MRRKKPYIRHVKTKCTFCETKTVPDYKEYQILRTHVTERGKLLAKSRTGACQKHQKRLTVAVKRARHLARLPFVTSLK